MGSIDRSDGRAVAAFLVTTACGAVPAVVAIVNTRKLELHAAINAHHTALGDLFFRYVTHLGDGLVPTGIALLLLFWKNWRAFLLTGLSAGLSALLLQLLKRTFFADIDRPSMFFDQMPGIAVVDGVELHHHFSFPSGHSTAAFSTGLALAVLFGRQLPAFAFAVLACVIGFSRVYISQHFTEDVLAGALIGSLTALALWWWLYKSSFSHRTWLERRPFRRQNQ